MKISTIICYCTNDYRFIKKCIDEALKFSFEVFVVVGDHFFHGKKENQTLLQSTYLENQKCKFIEFQYLFDRLYSPYHSAKFGEKDWIRLWHSTQRYLGFLHVSLDAERVLFLDADEIIDGDAFQKWLERKEDFPWNAVRFFAYYYLQNPTLRSKTLQIGPLFAKKSALDPLPFYQIHERAALFHQIPEPKAVGGGFEGKPFVHHYSWTRKTLECLKKASSWGHREDQNWEKAIKNSFEGNELKEFFHKGFEVEEVQEPFFDPFSIKIPLKKQKIQDFDHVYKVDLKRVKQLELEKM